MAARTFALKESVAKDFAGATVAGPGGSTIDIKARLGESGVIKTSDPDEIAAFQGHDALKEVSGSSSSEKKGGS